MVALLLRPIFYPGRSTAAMRRPTSFLGGRGFSSAASSPPSQAAYADIVEPSRLRNVALFGAIRHGKTTLMEALLQQRGASLPNERALDPIVPERGHGYTRAYEISSLAWKKHELNVIDTPGFCDFAGEVERVMGMVEGAILVVDAVEGPTDQTKSVVQKLFKSKLSPIIFVNKVERPEVSEVRCYRAEHDAIDLFAELGARDGELDYPVFYGSAQHGWASPNFTKSLPDDSKNMKPLLEEILKHVPSPSVSLVSPFQMLVSRIERDCHSSDLVLTGRISSGIIRVGDTVDVLRSTESGIQKIEEGKVQKLVKPKGSKAKDRIAIECAGAGDFISVTGLSNPIIGDTVANFKVLTNHRERQDREKQKQCFVEYSQKDWFFWKRLNCSADHGRLDRLYQPNQTNSL